MTIGCPEEVKLWVRKEGSKIPEGSGGWSHQGQDKDGGEMLTCQLVSNGRPVMVMRWTVRRGRGAMRG